MVPSGEGRCPYCHEAVAGEAVTCKGCRTVVHQECASQNSTQDGGGALTVVGKGGEHPTLLHLSACSFQESRSAASGLALYVGEGVHFDRADLRSCGLSDTSRFQLLSPDMPNSWKEPPR